MTDSLRKIIIVILIINVSGTFAQKSIYYKGWNDLNKNGEKDIYEDQQANIDERVKDLIGNMNMQEKTCQMVTLYGYKRVLKDMLPGEPGSFIGSIYQRIYKERLNHHY